MQHRFISSLRRLSAPTLLVAWRLAGSYATFTGLAAVSGGTLLTTLLLTLLIQAPLAALAWLLGRGRLRRAVVLALYLRWSARKRQAEAA